MWNPGVGDHRGAERDAGRITGALREHGGGDHRGAEEPGGGITEGNRREITGALR